MKKILLLIFDGLGDQPIASLDNRTPLEMAAKKNLDSLAERGSCGVIQPLPEGLYPTSEECHLALFGYDFQKDYPGRGVLEALGLDLKLNGKEIAFRANFGTVDDDLILKDPRAGLITDVRMLAHAVSGKEIGGINFELVPSLGHRAVLILRGEPVNGYLSEVRRAVITDTDPHKAGPHQLGVRVLKPRDEAKTEKGQLIAKALEEYQLHTHQILNTHPVNQKRRRQGQPLANFILTRGSGNILSRPSFRAKYGLRACCIAGAPLYKGIARYLGMTVREVRGATGTLETNIKSKVKSTKLALREYDFVFLHFKGTDIAAEDYGDPRLKTDFIQRVDKQLGSLPRQDIVIAVTGDHSTVCATKDHSADPVPLLIYDGIHQDAVLSFGEKECRRGRLGTISGADLMPLLLKLGGKNV